MATNDSYGVRAMMICTIKIERDAMRCGRDDIARILRRIANRIDGFVSSGSRLNDKAVMSGTVQSVYTGADAIEWEIVAEE
jgi:hypothetical protein